MWNPRKWPVRATILDAFQRNGEAWTTSWSSGRSKSIIAGDRLFLCHVGAEPRGIIASGIATASPTPGRHWNPVLAKLGRKTLFVPGRFEVVLDPRSHRILSTEDLEAAGIRFNWTPRASGIQIPAVIASQLEELWARRVGRHDRLPVVESTALENLRTETTSYNRGRSRKLRDEAIQMAQGVCESCGIDFSRLLGGRGERVLQVHHRRQLAASDKPRLTKVSQLAVLCANCHCLVHMDPKRAMPVAKLRKLLAVRRPT